MTKVIKPRAIVVGLGGMGTAVAYGMSQLDFDITVVEPNKEQLEAGVIKLKELGVSITSAFNDFMGLPDITLEYPIGDARRASVVISCVPYAYTYAIAKECRICHLHYCDLGGNPDVSKSIHALFEARKGPLAFTDLGLAPGWANIVAEECYAEKVAADDVVERVAIYVGGLPVHPRGSLQYAQVFNLMGLYNEYNGQCDILRGGEAVQVEALSVIEDFKSPFHNVSWLECFHTKGGLSNTLQLMQSRGVKECAYKTLRFPGHAKLMRFMFHDLHMTPELFENLVSKACPPTKEDQVYMIVRADGVSGKSTQRNIHIKHNMVWTAMQMATAWPTCAVAAIMASGTLDNIGHQVLTYADVPLESFNTNLKKIGLEY